MLFTVDADAIMACFLSSGQSQHEAIWQPAPVHLRNPEQGWVLKQAAHKHQRAVHGRWQGLLEQLGVLMLKRSLAASSLQSTAQLSDHQVLAWLAQT